MPAWVKINMPVSTHVFPTFPPPGTVAGAPGAEHTRLSLWVLLFHRTLREPATVPFGEKGRY